MTLRGRLKPHCVYPPSSSSLLERNFQISRFNILLEDFKNVQKHHTVLRLLHAGVLIVLLSKMENTIITWCDWKIVKRGRLQRWRSNIPTAHNADSVLSTCKAAYWIKALPTNPLNSLWQGSHMPAHTETHSLTKTGTALLRLMCLFLWLHSHHFHTYHTIPMSLKQAFNSRASHTINNVHHYMWWHEMMRCTSWSTNRSYRKMYHYSMLNTFSYFLCQ